MEAVREREYWEGLVRPVPRVASPLAQAGTLFHEWAQRYIMPDFEPSSGLLDVTDQTVDDSLVESQTPSGSAVPLGPEAMAERRRMLADLDEEEAGRKQGGSDRTARNLRIWERRLAESEWGQRTPAWVERPIVAVLDGTIVKGKLDAVFRGGLDQDDGSKLYTIVDWKTGARPTTEEDISEKLAQLDMYRILLSRLEGIDLSTIDACLYYVSEAQPSRRLIRARPRSQEEILQGLRRGAPQESDND